MGEKPDLPSNEGQDGARASPPRFGGAFDIVAIGSSAGGLRALGVLLSGIPADFPAPIVAVQHLDPAHPSIIAELLGRKAAISTGQAIAGDLIRPGRFYIAPPDHHMLIEPNGTVALTQTELVHFLRPSADLLFESVAATYRERAIAVVLTGTGLDGSSGVVAIRKTGGIVIAQDEATSDFFGMPSAAIDTGCANFILPLEQIAPQLVSLVSGLTTG